MSHGKVTINHHPLSSNDGSVSFETTYVIPRTEIETDQNRIANLNNNNNNDNDNKLQFIVQKQPSLSSTISNANIIITSSKSNEMTKRKNLSFVDAVNSKYLDLSTGLFSSPFPFALSSSYSSSSPFSSSTSPPDHHRHPRNHFSSSSSSPPHTTDNKNLLSTSPLLVNNYPPPVGADSTITTTNTTTSITLKEAIDTNILDARSAYVVDTLEQR